MEPATELHQTQNDSSGLALPPFWRRASVSASAEASSPIGGRTSGSPPPNSGTSMGLVSPDSASVSSSAGGFAGALLGGSWSWKAQLALFLIPTMIYGLMFLGQKMPKSEASEKGLSLGEMMKDVGLLGGAVVCLLIVLFCKEALGGMLSLLCKNDFFVSPTWSYISWGVGIV